MFDRFKDFFSRNGKVREKNHSRRILIVDDSEIDRKLISTIVGRLGYAVISSINGEDGLKTAIAEKPDLILLDCEMPVMDGMEMCRRLRDHEATEKIPVIFITAADTPKNVIDCFSTEAASYLTKPVNSKILSSQIESILEEYSPK